MNDIQAYINDIKNYELLDEETERALAEANTPEARNELVVHNLRLAVSLAKTYQNKGLPLDDLIQEANVGLMKAADKFDVSKGFRFSTFASWWIRQALSRAIANNGRTIRIPAHIIEANSKIEKAYTELRAELGREPSAVEVGEKVGKTEKEIESIREYFLDPMSIDTNIGEDEDSTIGNLIADNNIESPIEYCLESEESEIVNQVLATIPEREANIIRLRIQEGKSLEDVGKILDLSVERVRQLELKALRKLRNPIRANILRSAMS